MAHFRNHTSGGVPIEVSVLIYFLKLIKMLVSIIILSSHFHNYNHYIHEKFF